MTVTPPTTTNAAVVTVATVGDSVGVGDVAAATDTVINGTVANTGTVKQQNFHTGLDPVSRTNNSAKPTEFNAAAAADKVRFAQLFSLDTGSSPVWSVVAGTDATDNNRAAAVAGTVATVGGGVSNGAVATVTVTNPDDETIVNNGKKVSSSYRQDAGIQTHG